MGWKQRWRIQETRVTAFPARKTHLFPWHCALGKGESFTVFPCRNACVKTWMSDCGQAGPVKITSLQLIYQPPDIWSNIKHIQWISSVSLLGSLWTRQLTKLSDFLRESGVTSGYPHEGFAPISMRVTQTHKSTSCRCKGRMASHHPSVMNLSFSQESLECVQHG